MEDNEYYFIGSEEEAHNFERIIDFGEDKDTQQKYNMLISRYKRCVDNTLDTLTDNNDFFGYNLKQILKSYKNATPHISQLQISEQLVFDSDMGDYYISDKSSHKDVNNELDSLKKTASPKKNSRVLDYVNTICDYLLIDIELIETGIGKVYSIKDEWFEDYMEDDEFHKQANEDMENSWNTLLRIQKYEEYLISQNKLNREDSILEEQLAVITHTGKYLMLQNQKSKQNEANAIKRLIGELYALQLLDGKMNFEYVNEE